MERFNWNGWITFANRVLAIALIAFLAASFVGFDIYLSIEWNFDKAWWYIVSGIMFYLIAIPVWRHYK